MRNIQTIKLIAPAKVNLFLAIGPKLCTNSKKHPVLNIMHSLLLHDKIYMTATPTKDCFSVSAEFLQSDDVDVVPPKIESTDNIVCKAINRLYQKCSRKPHISISVIIEKNIPHQAGLGGGSSDAAAALIGAANFFKIKPTEPLIEDVAKEIGSDVVFFLKGGCGLYTKDGSNFDHEIMPVNREIVLVKPICEQNGLSTKQVYAQFDKMENIAVDFDKPVCIDNNPDAENCHKTTLNDATKRITHADKLALFNNLAYASECLMPKLVEIKNWMGNYFSEQDILLCGSGSATFAFLSEDFDKAEFRQKAKEQSLWCCYTQVANVKPRIMPEISQI